MPGEQRKLSSFGSAAYNFADATPCSYHMGSDKMGLSALIGGPGVVVSANVETAVFPPSGGLPIPARASYGARYRLTLCLYYQLMDNNVCHQPAAAWFSPYAAYHSQLHVTNPLLGLICNYENLFTFGFHGCVIR